MGDHSAGFDPGGGEMTLKRKIFSGMARPGAFWFRVFGRGLNFLRTRENPPLFSERAGLRKPFLRAFGWRVFWLPKESISLTNCRGKLDHFRPGDQVRVCGASDPAANGMFRATEDDGILDRYRQRFDGLSPEATAWAREIERQVGDLQLAGVERKNLRVAVTADAWEDLEISKIDVSRDYLWKPEPGGPGKILGIPFEIIAGASRVAVYDASRRISE